MAAPEPRLNGRPAVARRLAEFAVHTRDVPAAALARTRAALADMLGCAIEAGDLPWGRQSIAFAEAMPPGPCGIVGTGLARAPMDAAFANAALAHGLVREDMHVAACSHIGVVVWPTLLALAQWHRIDDDDLIAAAAIGYEIAASVGRELFDADLAARIRPTSTVCGIGAAAAAARLLGLDAERTQAAIGLAANGACGLNEWPWANGTDMVFHAGFAARNALTAAHLASLGAVISPTSIDGRAGLFAAFGRAAKADAVEPLGRGGWEIMAVYFKPAPACNYVQTPCQVALDLTRQGVRAEDVAALEIHSFPHAIRYPGCDQAGPWAGVLEGKMSLQFSVAAVLVHGAIAEANYRDLAHPEIARLAGATRLVVDPALEAAYPQRQGARLVATLRDGTTRIASLPDVAAVDEAGVHARLAAATTARLGAGQAGRLAAAIAALGEGGRAADVVAAAAAA